MKKFILVLLCTVSTFAAKAQLTLSLDEALSIALSDNPTIAIAQMEIQRYDYVKREAWSNLLPQLSVGGQYSYAAVKSEIAKGISFGADNTFSAAADLSVPLVMPTIYRTLQLNKAQLASAVEAARKSKIDLTAEVRKSFYNILLAEQSLSVLEESEKTTSKVANDTKIKFDNGLASEYDFLTAQVQLSNLRPTILNAKNSIAISKLALKMYLSIPENIDIDVVGSLDDFKNELINATQPLSTDISQNSDLKTLELQEQVLVRQRQVVGAGYIPTLVGFGQFTYSGSDIGNPFAGMGGTGTGTTTSSGSKSYFWQHPVTVGAKLSIPIFDGTNKYAKRKQISNSISQLRMQRDYTERGLEVQAKTAVSNLITARESMLANEQTVAQSQKAYYISATRYNAGAGTILELNSAQLSVTQAQLSYSQSIYDYLSAKAEYDKVTGQEYEVNQ